MALRLDMNLTLTPELRQLALRIGVGLALLCLAAYALIGMPLLEARKLDSELAETKGRLERHQKLIPTVTSIIASAHNATIGSLAAPKQEPTPRAQAYLLTEQLAHMATAAGLGWDANEAHSAVYDTEQTARLFCTIANAWPR